MGWLAGWSYRKSFTISRASGAVTDYQMKLLLGESAGTTGDVVDCGGKCLSTFNDIRFTASDGTTVLNHWIEFITGSTPNQLATIWIKFNTIGTGATTFYMYYGNVSAPAVSDGVNTFLFFDDFELNNLSRWTTAQAQWSTQSTVKKYGTYAAYGDSAATNRILSKTITLSDRFIIHGWLRPSLTTNYCGYLLVTQNAALKYPFTFGGLTSGHIEYFDGTYHDFSPVLTFLGGTWYEVDIYCDVPNNSFFLKYNGIVTNPVTTVLNTYDVSNVQLYLSATVNKDFYADNFYIRKYVDPEPVWGSFSDFDTVGERWCIDKDLYYAGSASAKCNSIVADEPLMLRGISKTVSWGSIKMTGWFRTNATNATCQTGAYVPVVSTGQYVQALEFLNGHFQHYDVVGGHQTFPNDKTFFIDTWYSWEVIFDFENSLQKTTVSGVDLGDIALKDIDGTVLDSDDLVTIFRMTGSSAVSAVQFNIDSILVYSYPSNDLLFSSNFDGGWGNETGGYVPRHGFANFQNPAIC